MNKKSVIRFILIVLIIGLFSGCKLRQTEEVCTESEITKKLNNYIGEGKSLNEIEKLLNNQKCIIDVSIPSEIIKTNPPMKDIKIIYLSDEGRVEAFVEVIQVIATDNWKFTRIHS